MIFRRTYNALHQAALSAQLSLERNPLAFVEGKKGRESQPGNRTRANSIARRGKGESSESRSSFSCVLQTRRLPTGRPVEEIRVAYGLPLLQVQQYARIRVYAKPVNRRQLGNEIETEETELHSCLLRHKRFHSKIQFEN